MRQNWRQDSNVGALDGELPGVADDRANRALHPATHSGFTNRWHAWLDQQLRLGAVGVD